MQQQNQIDAKVIIQIPSVQMHRIIKNNRLHFTSGVLRLCQLAHENQKVYFINLNSFFYTITKETVFFKVIYTNSFTYCYSHFDNGITSITIEKSDQENLNKLEQIFKNVALLLTYDEAIQNQYLHRIIQINCPDILHKPIVPQNKLQRYIKIGGTYIGSGFQWLGKHIGNNIKKLGNYFEEKIQPQKNPTVIKKKRKSWSQLKEGTGTVYKVSNQFFSSIFNPVVQKGKQYAGKISDKINKSDSANVKYLKQLGSCAVDALGTAINGFGNALSEVSHTVSETSGQLWQRKYGLQNLQKQQIQNAIISGQGISTDQITSQKSIQMTNNKQIAESNQNNQR